MKIGYMLCFGIVLTIMLSMPIAFAQQTELPDAGVTPDNSFFYGFKRFFEGIDMFFTFSNMAKAEKHVYYAGLRLSEAKTMADQNKYEHINNLAYEYKNNIEHSMQLLQFERNNGVNTTEVERQIAEKTQSYLGVLEQVRNVVSESSKQSIQEAITASENARESVVNELKEKGALGNIQEEV